MASPALTIQQKIVTLMRADTDFAGIGGYVIGSYFMPPAVQNYPVVEVIIGSERETPISTGSYWRTLSGFLRFNTHTQERITFDANDTYTVVAQTTLYDYVQSAIDLFQKKSNITLGGLTVTNGVVQEFKINTQAVYDIGERVNSYEYQAVIDFEVTIRVSRDLT